MEKPIDYEQLCREELNILQNQETKISKLKDEISRLKLKKAVVNKETVKENINEVILEEKKEDDSFKDEMNFYLLSYRQLSEDFTKEEINEILPKKKNPKFKDILLRLSLESVKEIKEVKELLREEEISLEEKELCNKIIESENKKIDYIKSKLIVSDKEEIEEQEEKNNIVLVPMLSGNIRIIDDLEHIPNDYYEGFKDLINSIIDGTFKNVKTFSNNEGLIGISEVKSFKIRSEVKSFKIRVVFKRLNDNTYALITAFMKKWDNDKLYQESLISKVKEYYLIESDLKKLINDHEFMEENEKNVQQLWNVLSPKEEIKRKEIV